MAPTLGFLQTLLEQVDEKHALAHSRLRHDLTEGLDDMNREIERLREIQLADHEDLVRQQALRDHRKEMTAFTAIVLGAAISGAFRLVELILNAWLGHGHP